VQQLSIDFKTAYDSLRREVLIKLAQNRDRWWALVKAVMNLWVP